jgi:hypothetical protein
MLKEFVPQEGDLVRVQLAKPLGYPRDYMLVIWPNPSTIPPFGNIGYGIIGHVNVNCSFVINMIGKLHANCCFGLNSEDKLVRPTVSDMLYISRILYENKMRYNRKTKQLIHNYESNR